MRPQVDAYNSRVGYWKQRLIQQDEQGWKYSDKAICPRCVKDTHLKELVRAAVSTVHCDFCRTSRPRRGAPFDVLTRAVAETFFQYYRPAVDHLGYDGGEGGYFGTTYDTWDLVHDEFSDVSDNEEVLKEIIDCLGDETWCDVNPYGFAGAERYAVSWSAFCRTVKHRTRYFFHSAAAQEERLGSDNELTPVPEVLAEIAEVIQTAGMDVVLAVDSPLFRVRPHHPGTACTKATELGPPPEDLAPNNRMSAAGVSVFYGAFELPTAVSEVAAGLPKRHGKVLTGAEWRTKREFHLIDLTRLPTLGSPYAEHREDRAPLVFLRQFVGEITQPVTHDGKEHIEYVLPQVLTEYLRLQYRSASGHVLDGIVYPSAQRQKGRSVVLFVSHRDLNGPFSARDAALTLVDTSIQQIPAPRRRRKRPTRRRP